MFVTGFLGGDWLDSDAAVLLASELAANAVLHSLSGRPGGKFTVRAAVKPGEYLWVEVEDEGGTWITQAADGECGRGLDIVAAIADEWGRDGDPVTGWVVWARLRASRSRARAGQEGRGGSWSVRSSRGSAGRGVAGFCACR